MGSSSPAPQTQTTQYNMSPEQRQILGLAMPSLSGFAEANPTAANIIPSTSGVAGFNPTQLAGQQQVLGAAQGQAGVTGSAAGGNQYLTSGAVLDPNTNPGLRGAITAATRPITTDLLEKALPAVRSGAEAANQFGGSRQGIAEGQAIRGAEEATADATAKVVNPAYQAGLDAMTKNIGLAPSVAQGLAIPGVTTSGVGDVQQALTQQQLTEQQQRQQTSAMWPLMMGQQLAGIAGALPGGGTTTTASGPQAPSGLSQALGFGGMGLSALSSLMPLMMASDRRTKRILRKLSATFRGIPLYVFTYLGDSLPRVGVMADEVPAYARVRFNGVDFVDYGAL